MRWEEYAEEHPYFIDKNVVSELLEKLLKHPNDLNRPFSIIDLGYGDGAVLHALHNRGLPRNANRAVGIDVSKERIKRLTRFCPSLLRALSRMYAI